MSNLLVGLMAAALFWFLLVPIVMACLLATLVEGLRELFKKGGKNENSN